MNAPRRDVVDAELIEGPRGGTIALMTLSCGHGLWRRQKQPSRTVDCITCWLNTKYPPVEDDMTFGQAIEALKDGKKVAREGWNGKDMWLCYMPPVDILKGDVNQRTQAHMTPELADFVDRHGLPVGGYIVMWTAQKVWQPGWLASQPDLLSEDWFVVS